jgi:hypothetical protein
MMITLIIHQYRVRDVTRGVHYSLSLSLSQIFIFVLSLSFLGGARVSHNFWSILNTRVKVSSLEDIQDRYLSLNPRLYLLMSGKEETYYLGGLDSVVLACSSSHVLVRVFLVFPS